MKFIKFILIVVVLPLTTIAQEIIEEEVVKKPTYNQVVKNGKKKIDGIIATVGEYIILDSDIDLQYIDMKTNDFDINQISRCEILGKLMEDKLYAHHAKLDTTIVVIDAEIKADVDERLSYMIKEAGSIEKIVKFYNKKDEEELRNFIFEISKNNKLTMSMQNKIVDEVDITPEEVRTFFKSLAEDELPEFGAEIEIANIVIQPEVTQADKQKAIDKLNRIREDILNGSSFTTQAVLNTDDVASRSNGGYYKMNRKTQFVKEFKDVAFSLREGEISKPFETEFGFHIIYCERIRGQEIEVRHILIIPKVTEKAIKEAREKATNIRNKIISGELTFQEAAKNFSDEKETRANGGQMLNPRSMDSKFELTKMDPMLYSYVQDLKIGEVSRVIKDEDRRGVEHFKIFMITNRVEPHIADYSLDYVKIRDLALKEKQINAISKWTDEKIKETYILINQQYKDCDFVNNWLKL